MSVETTTLEKRGRELGESIRETEAYQEFEEARRAVEDHDELQEQIQEVNELRQQFHVARQNGQATQADVDAVRQAQQELHDHPVMEQFLTAQAELQQRLTAINDAISEPLAVDFGDEASGCCND